jgi:hypothetical protein
MLEEASVIGGSTRLVAVWPPYHLTGFWQAHSVLQPKGWSRQACVRRRCAAFAILP